MMEARPTVGVAPGTATLQLGDPSCPPDEWPQTAYVMPPEVQEGPPPGVPASATLFAPTTYYDPYTDEPSLKGVAIPGYQRRNLGQSSFTDDLSNASWGLVAFAGIAAFAGVFLVMYTRDWYKRRRS